MHQIFTPFPAFKWNKIRRAADRLASTGGSAPVVGAPQGVRSIHQDDGVAEEVAGSDSAAAHQSCLHLPGTPTPSAAAPSAFAPLLRYHVSTLLCCQLHLASLCYAPVVSGQSPMCVGESQEE
eukprot:scaffold21221_cov60-Phaeocystis_antarctica.AAC.3